MTKRVIRPVISGLLILEDMTITGYGYPDCPEVGRTDIRNQKINQKMILQQIYKEMHKKGEWPSEHSEMRNMQ